MGNLNLPNVAAAQNQKEVTINDQKERMDIALTESLSVDLTAGDVTLTDEQFRENYAHYAINAPSVRVLTVPNIKRPFIVINSSDTYTLTVKKGITEISVPTESAVGFYSDGDADGLYVYGGSSIGGGGATDHGALTGLGDDDHTQYHNDSRGDARYYVQGTVDTLLLAKVGTTRQVASTHSITGGGDLSADRTLSLVGDAATPGNSKYYGTDGTGTKGYFDLPSAGSADHGALTGLGDDDHTQYHNDSRGDARYYVQGTVDTLLLAKVGTTRQVASTHSITGGGDLSADRTLSLVGDAATPGNSKYYGTDGTGTKGYHDVSALGVTSVFGRTGVVTAQSNDYSISQITGAGSLASLSQVTETYLGPAAVTPSKMALGAYANRDHIVANVSTTYSLTAQAHHTLTLTADTEISLPTLTVNSASFVCFARVIPAGYALSFNGSPVITWIGGSAPDLTGKSWVMLAFIISTNISGTVSILGSIIGYDT